MSKRRRHQTWDFLYALLHHCTVAEPCTVHVSLASVYSKHEQLKRRSYEERIREVEHASFLPLVFSATGGSGKAAHAFYKRLGHMIAEKRKEPYSLIMAWIRSLLSFALVRACNMSMRGHRTSAVSANRVDIASPASLAVNDCHLR